MRMSSWIVLSLHILCFPSPVEVQDGCERFLHICEQRQYESTWYALLG